MKTDMIRPIAICLFRNDDRILVLVGHDDVKGDDFCRPLGGGINFGETSRDALVREMREELGAEVEGLHLVDVIESIFTHNGQMGHEIVFVYDARFCDRAMYEKGIIECREDNGARFTAMWLSLDEMHASQIRLVPDGVEKLLLAQNGCVGL